MGYLKALTCFLALINLSQCLLDPCFYNCEDRSFDLTHPVYQEIPAYPGLYFYAYDQTLAYEFPEPNFLLAFNYSISGLAGTSLTAPASFFPNSRQIHEIPHEQLTRVEGKDLCYIFLNLWLVFIFCVINYRNKFYRTIVL